MSKNRDKSVQLTETSIKKAKKRKATESIESQSTSAAYRGTEATSTDGVPSSVDTTVKPKTVKFRFRNKYLHLALQRATKTNAISESDAKEMLQKQVEWTSEGALRKKTEKKRKRDGCEFEDESRAKKVKRDSTPVETDKAKRKSENPETLKENESVNKKKRKRRRKKKTATNGVLTQDVVSSTLVDADAKKTKRKLSKSSEAVDEAEPHPVSSSQNGDEPKRKKKKGSPAEDPIERSKTLQSRMMEKLHGSRFRYLNEQLYSVSGKDAFELFQSEPSLFDVYHKGFQRQVAKWPMNPLDLIIKNIKSKHKSMVVADFGCGDARLARSVKNTVHSFDLVAVNDSVVVCDMSKVPLEKESVDIAVFCLSLMGGNLVKYLTEAHRVLKRGGLLKVAEVESRFYSVDKFVGAVQKLGFSLLAKDDSHRMFVLFDFEKTGRRTTKTQKCLKLKPCLYKKR